MINRPDTRSQRIKRHKRVRAKISGTPERPRLNVFRSGTNIYAQIIDDSVGKTLAAIVNLPPRKMMGLESNGMLLSAVHTEKGEEKLNLIMLDDQIPAGSKLC